MRLVGCVLQIPLLRWPDRLKDQVVADCAARAAVGPAELPSAVFFSCVNSKQTLASMAFSQDVKMVRGGREVELREGGRRRGRGGRAGGEEGRRRGAGGRVGRKGEGRGVEGKERRGVRERCQEGRWSGH